MIKIVFSEVESPTNPEDATTLNSSSGVRAVNSATKAALISILSVSGESKSITLAGGESVILKKGTLEKVYSSSKTIRIAGVSIY